MIKRPNKIKGLFALLLLLSFGGAFAQQSFKYRAALPKVDSDGFYKIILQPSLAAKGKYIASDMRITGADGKFVPYLFGSQLPVKGEKEFIVFPKSTASKETDTSTIYIVENTGHYIINQLLFKMRHSAVFRLADVSGSDDQMQWYAIKEGVVFNEEMDTTGTYQPVLHFPPSTYRYFKIQIYHKHKEPIDILSASINRSRIIPATYLNVPISSFTQKDSNKITHVTIKLNEPYLINKLTFDIRGPKYFKRTLTIYQDNGNERRPVTTEISSTGTNSIELDNRTSKLEIKIANDDNPPLNIKGITAYQGEQSIISYLEKGKQYQILVGDSTAIAPEYDLKFFTDSLHKTLPVIQHGVVTANPLYQAKPIKTEKSIPTWVIWLAIIAALVVLGLLTYKMVGEVNKRSSEEKM